MNGKDATILALYKTYTDIYNQLADAAANWQTYSWVKSTYLSYDVIRHLKYTNTIDKDATTKLLRAYALKGTYEGIVLACEALIGSGIVIKSSAPGTIDVEVHNTSILTELILSDSTKTKMLALEDAAGLKAHKLIGKVQDDARTSLLELVREFITAGVELTLISVKQKPALTVNDSYLTVSNAVLVV